MKSLPLAMCLVFTLSGCCTFGSNCNDTEGTVSPVSGKPLETVRKNDYTEILAAKCAGLSDVADHTMASDVLDARRKDVLAHRECSNHLMEAQKIIRDLQSIGRI